MNQVEWIDRNRDFVALRMQLREPVLVLVVPANELDGPSELLTGRSEVLSQGAFCVLKMAEVQLRGVLPRPALRRFIEQVWVGKRTQVTDLDHEIKLLAKPLLQLQNSSQHMIHAPMHVADEADFHSSRQSFITRV
jgi:hypothetical protein